MELEEETKASVKTIRPSRMIRRANCGVFAELSKNQNTLSLTYACIFLPYCGARGYFELCEDSGYPQKILVCVQLALTLLGLLVQVFLWIMEREFFSEWLSSKAHTCFSRICGIAVVGSVAVLLAVEKSPSNCNFHSDNVVCEGSFADGSIMFVPLALLLGFPLQGVPASGCYWAMCFAAKLAAAIYEKSVPDIVAAVMQAVVCVMAMRELTAHKTGADQNHQSGDIVLLASQQIAELDNNVKQMVANVAHDLKTPVASFMAGVEYIISVLDEVMSAQTGVPAQVLRSLTDIDNCIRVMKNTNAFMLMTINRCIDYTKASKGLRLVPKYETIDLMETLSLPLHCMKDIQNRVVVIMETVPSAVCSHLITDKQWLQENVLCLLSNAVKYSSEGLVTVSVRLEEGSVREVPVRRSFVVDSPPARPSLGRNSTKRSPSTTKSFQIAPSSGLELDRCDSKDWTCESPSRSSGKGQFLRVEVEDMGIGMSNDDMESLFSPFKQNQRLAGGTGLGLFSLSKRVEALQGQCGVTKRRDGKPGSLFWFCIPYRPDHTAVRLADTTISQDDLGLGCELFGYEDQDQEVERSLTAQAASFQSLMTADLVHRAPPSAHPPSPTAYRSSPHVFRSSPTVHQPDHALDHPGLQPAHSLQSNASNSLTFVPSFRSGRSGLNILLVDDSDVVVRMTTMMLNRGKHTVNVASNGADAKKMIMEEHEARTLRAGKERRPRFNSAVSDDLGELLHAPSAATGDDEPAGELVFGEPAELDLSAPCFDVILMDLQMPVMDGIEATRRIREWEASLPIVVEERTFSVDTMDGGAPWSNLRITTTPTRRLRHFILGVSANCDDDVMADAQAAGLDAFISKPFNMDTFHQVLQSHHKLLPQK